MIPNTSDFVVFSHQAVTVDDIRPNHLLAVAIMFENCTSTSWKDIGSKLSSLKQLQSLVLIHCNTGNLFYEQLCISNSILFFRLGSISYM